MSFFGDIKIIFKSLFTRNKNSIDKETKKEEKPTFMLEFSKPKTPEENKNFSYYSSKANIFKSNNSIKKYNEFSLFAFVKNKELVLTDYIKVSLECSLEPSICLNYETGYDLGVYEEEDYLLVKEHYNKYGKFIGNDGNNKGRKINYNSIPYVSYKLSKDKLADVIVEYKNTVTYKVGTILRRHKTSGNGYYSKHRTHIETIANLMHFNPVSIKMKSKYKGEIDYPISSSNFYKVALDIINEKLLFVSLNKGIIKAYVIESVLYELNRKDDSTQKVELNLDNGDIIELYAPDNCFLHNRKF